MLPIPLNQGQDDAGYFSRHRITIYDDPRELIDPRRVESQRRNAYMTRTDVIAGGSGIYHHTPPRLDFRPSAMRPGDFYDEYRGDNFRRYIDDRGC